MPKRAALATAVVAAAVVSLFAPTAAYAATKTVTVTATAKSMTYGSSEPALTYTVTGLAKGDALTRKPTCTVPSHKAVGRYTITCSGASANSAKYTLRYVSALFYVYKAPLTIAANYQQKSYADPDPKTFGYSVSGLARGDKFVTAPTCDVDGPHTDAGKYVIECSGANAGPNYTISYLPQYYVIGKSYVLVGPAQSYVYYGGEDPEFTFLTFGLKDGEKLETDPVCGVVDENHEHVGRYVLRCTGAEVSDNYILKVVDSTFDVVQTGSYVQGDNPVINPGLLGPTGGRLTAHLYAALGLKYQAYPDATLTFTSGDTTLCSAQTDSSGQASCALDANAAKVVANGGYTVTYAGTADVAGSHHDVKNA